MPGQALVEFALAVSVFVFVLMGLFDIGRAVANDNTISQSAREAARLGAVEAAWVGSGANCRAPICPSNAAELRKHIVDAANHVAGVGTVEDGQVAIDCGGNPPKPDTSWKGNDCTSGNGSGQFVTVRVTYRFVPVIQLFTFELAHQATMTIN